MLKRLILIITLGFVGAFAIIVPAHAAPVPYQVCNSGNSAGPIMANQTSFPYGSKYIRPGSVYCYTFSGGLAIEIDPEAPGCSTGDPCAVERYRYRYGDSNQYGNWVCGEGHFLAPDHWWNNGGIDVETSHYPGTTC